MSELFIYNTLTGKKEQFTPLDDKHVRIYACGPTVYSYAHIGNGRMAVVFDVLSRLLKSVYPKVTYVSNITDVDDKIIEAAKQTNVAISDLTQKFTKIYNQDMASLGVLAPDIQPLATDYIQDMIDLIKRLEKAGHAYVSQDGNENSAHVLFHVPSYPEYGALSGRSREAQIAGARVEVASYKKDPADFVLWKPSAPDQPGWDSPWGYGRPGWHIECSAMAECHLGLPFDIHGGGADLKFPHHENEIAQSCCAHGHQDNPDSFAKYWIHNGFVTVDGEKISKSLGNVVLVHDLIEQGISGEVARFALLSAHYRQPLDWTQEGLNQARSQLDRFYQTLYSIPPSEVSDEHELYQKFLSALSDDLNTPRAIGILNGICQRANSSKDPVLSAVLRKSAAIMGFLLEDPARWLGYGEAEDASLSADVIEDLLKERQQAKKQKNFPRADEIRDQLNQAGILIEDTPEGPKWRKKK